MRRIIAIAAAALLLAIPAAHAAEFASIGLMQIYLENHSPYAIEAEGPQTADIDGTITEIYWCNYSNHYEMVVEADEPRAIHPLDSDMARMIVHFRLHLDEPPFAVGDPVTVRGTLNPLYSSVVIPVIDATEINGSDDF